MVGAVQRPRGDVARLVHWVLGNPAAFLNTAGDLTLLPCILDAAERFAERPRRQTGAVLWSSMAPALFSWDRIRA